MALVFQCPTCRALVSASEVSVPLDGKRAGLQCGACGAVAWLPASGAVDAEATASDAQARARVAPSPALPPPAALVARPDASPAAPPAAAPAVSSSSTGPFSSAQQALVAAKLKQLAPATDAQRDVAAAFEKLLGSWQDPAAQKAFVQRASAVGELAFAGQSFRAVLDAVPQEPMAKKGQNEILALAMASMSAARDIGSPERTSRVPQMLLIGAVVVFLLVMGILMPRLLRNGLGGSTMDPTPAGAGQE